MSPTLGLLDSVVLTSHQGREGIDEVSFLLEIQLADVIVLDILPYY